MKTSKKLPSQDRLKELLTYDPISGLLVWAVSRQRIKAGTPVGFTDDRGYLRLKVDNIPYFAHRIIWKLVTGNDPIDEIDHINGNSSDNSFANLREADRFQNMANRKRPCDSTSGIKGVCFHKKTQKWYAQLQVGNHKRYLGVYEKIEDAEKAVIAARSRLHGEFARAA